MGLPVPLFLGGTTLGGTTPGAAVVGADLGNVPVLGPYLGGTNLGLLTVGYNNCCGGGGACGSVL
jgi:hypothetical protein